VAGPQLMTGSWVPVQPVAEPRGRRSPNVNAAA
jgi:hypothetical protein